MKRLCCCFVFFAIGVTCKPYVRASDTSPETQEAMKVSSEFFSHHVAHCGDSYYAVSARGGRGVMEMKQVSIQMQPSPLTEAQKLNGLLWDGRAVYAAKVSRSSSIQNDKTKLQWSPWGNGGGIALDVQKLNGQWSVKEPYTTLETAPDCGWIERIQ